VEWVFAESTSAVAAQNVEPVHANFCHDTFGGTTLLGNQAHGKTFSWHSKILSTLGSAMKSRSTELGETLVDFVKCKYRIYKVSRAQGEDFYFERVSRIRESRTQKHI
jgi:hypothetical protein